MKHTYKPFLTTIIAYLVVAAFSLSPVYSQDNTSTDSGEINLETIKENVKKRIEEVVKGDSQTLTDKPVAYIGLLESVANTTLSVHTRDGIKQAATTSDTVFVRLPGNKSVKPEEIGIDEHVTAIGFMGNGEVLEARRVIVQAEAPANPIYSSYFGTVTETNTKAKTVTVTNLLTNETKVFLDTTKSNLISQGLTSDRRAELKAVANIPLNQLVIVIYTPAEEEGDDNIINELLVRADIESSPSVSPSPTASASAKVQGAKTTEPVPPELNR